MEGDQIVGTKAQLHQVLDDVDMITRQLINVLSHNNRQQQLFERGDNKLRKKVAENEKIMDVNQLARLLVLKQTEIQDLVKVAGQQKRLKKDISCIKDSILSADKRIWSMQKTFSEAERLQATSIYHAKELIKQLDKAQEQPVGSEHLVKYAHKISSSCSTMAPESWTYGDPRRPYPQDLEMKMGWLGQINNMGGRVDPNDPIAAVLRPLGTEGITLVDNHHSNKQQQNGSLLNSPQNVSKHLKEEAGLMSGTSSSDSSDSEFME